MFSQIIKLPVKYLTPRSTHEHLRWTDHQRKYDNYEPRKTGNSFITVDQNNLILDGHHRYQQLIKENPEQLVEVRQYVYSFRFFEHFLEILGGLFVGILSISLLRATFI